MNSEKLGKAVFKAAAIICVIAVVSIFAFLIIKSVPAFSKIGVLDFVFGDKWSPDRNDTYDDPQLSGTYGIFTMIVGTLAATAGALIIGGTIGFFTAVFIAFFCPDKLKGPFASVINLLAGIPSVVYGFFGIVFLLPKLAYFAPNNGSGLLATSIILGIMILPTVVSLSKTSLEAVPKTYYEGAVATGAAHTRAVFGVMVPAARSGITASLILGIGRALGETMAVVMVAGNAATYPSGFFQSFRVLTANIVMEMGYAGDVQEGALVATGVILLIFVLIVNVIFSLISGRAVKKAVASSVEKGHSAVIGQKGLRSFFSDIKERFGALSYKLGTDRIGKVVSVFCGAISGVALLLVVGFVFVKGFPSLISNPDLIFGKYEFASENITIFPAIVSTLMAVLLSLIIAFPIGLMTAVYLNEYAKKGNWFVRIIRGAIDILSGVPSIVYGLFGMITFVKLFGGSSSVLAGSFTISIMLLPVIVRSTEESLKSIAEGRREGSLALGAGKLRTVFRIVLPSALPGIVSALILSMGRVISESAPFIYTMGSVITSTPKSFLDSGATLAVALYQLSGEGWYIEEAYATAVVLIIIVFGLNLLAGYLGNRLNKKLRGNG